MVTLSIGQDHLECFFGKIRALHRQNDNSTVQQFSAAYRKLLCISDIRLSKFSDCQDVCYRTVASNILKVSSRKRPNARSNDLNECPGDKTLSYESDK